MVIPTDKSFAQQLQDKIDNLNKPKGSLGRLESLALQIGLIQHSLKPLLSHPCHILFGGDHGIERERVSCSPREVTWQQMQNYNDGGGGVNIFCSQHGFKLRIVDVGVDHDFDHNRYPRIIDRKIAYGTENFLYGPAMSADQLEQAFMVGREMVDECHDEGCNIISFGEMGIGNTSPSSIFMHMFLNIPLEQCVGAGSGLNDEGVVHKLNVLQKAVERFKTNNPETTNALTVIHNFAGYEMATAIGGMLRAAEHRMIVLVDGFIMTACMLAATRIDTAVMDYAIFTHCGDEGGHQRMLDAMGANPLLHLGLRLGEGTGALCAYPIVESAVMMINEMDNFQHAKITKYF